MEGNCFTSFLASGVIAAIVSALFTKAINDKNQKLKYITEERQNWRKDIREKTEKLVTLVYSYPINTAEIKSIKAFFVTRLNPLDDFDLSIIRSVQEISKANIDDFVLKVSCLLKHDWERVKIETRRTPKAIDLIGVLFLMATGLNLCYYFFPRFNDSIINSVPENLRFLAVSVSLTLVFLIFVPVFFYILLSSKVFVIKKLSISCQKYLDAEVLGEQYYEEVTKKK